MVHAEMEKMSLNNDFIKKADTIRNLLRGNLMDSFFQHVHTSTFSQSDSLARIVYSYLIYLAYDCDNFPNISLKEALNASDHYNPSISAYFQGSLNPEIFELLKTLVVNENIEKEVLEYILEEECSNFGDTTSKSITRLAIEILDIQEGETVADIGSGTGEFLFHAADLKPGASFTGFEVNTEMYLTSLMRNYFRYDKTKSRLSNVNILQTDAFDVALDLKTSPRFDKVFSNYPFGMQLKFSGIGQRYLKKLPDRWYSKMIPSSSGDWVFNMLIHDLTEKSPIGRAVGIMTGGSSWNVTEKAARRYFLDLGIVEYIISLPPRLFDYTNAPTMMVVFSSGHTAVRMIDATTFYHMGRRKNYMDDCDISRVVEALNTDSEHSRLVDVEEIMKQDYVLDPGRYLQQNLEIKNGVPFGSVIKSIRRGAQIRAKELDTLVSNKPTKTQYLMLSNIKDGLIDEELSSLTSIDESLEKYCLKEDDLILSKNGYPYKVAIAHLNPGQSILANGSLYIIELDQEKIIPLYLKAFLESELGVNSLKSITVGATIPNIAVGSLKKMIIPCPPIIEQQAIAEKYSENLEEIAVLRMKLERAINRLGDIF